MPANLPTSFVLLLAALVAPIAAAADLEPPEDRSEKIRWGFNTLNVDTMELLDDFYHEDVHFVDPVLDLKGLNDLRKHYEFQYAKAKEIGFAFISEHIAGDTHTVEWEMNLRTKRLNKGKPFTIPGVSVITFEEDKVLYHRDYFDLGDMLYERIFLVGFVSKKIKKRLHFDPDMETEE